MGRLGLGKRPTDLRQLQACAAVGQTFLMRAYEDCLAAHDIPTAQILLTAGDFDSRTRYLNARNTIVTLFEWGCLPIINENDTVSVAEIRFGDNDHLAAMVTNLLQAPLLVLLTVVDGLYTADPNTDPSAELVATVPHIDADVLDKAGASRSALGLRRHAKQAAGRPAGDGGGRIGHHGQRRAAGRARRHLPGRAGRHAVLAAQHHDAGLEALAGLHGPAARPARRRCRRPAGGADQGRSLLPIGVVQVVGTFGKGDVVALCDADGVEFARGLTNYSSTDGGATARPALRADRANARRSCRMRRVVHRG